MLLVKLLLTPLLMGIATLVARRWGPLVGGLFTALPLTSGPISVFLYIEQGPVFAHNAAFGSMLGYGAIAFFGVVLVHLMRGNHPVLGLLGASAAYFASAYGMIYLPQNAHFCFFFTCLVLLVGALCLGKARGNAKPPSTAWWDLPVRMVTAGGMVLGVTGIAHILGPDWSGYMATYPVFTALMAIFGGLQSGICSIILLLRGVLVGMIGSALFFYIILLTYDILPPSVAYTLATISNIIVNIIIFWIMKKRQPHNPPPLRPKGA